MIFRLIIILIINKLKFVELYVKIYCLKNLYIRVLFRVVVLVFALRAEDQLTILLFSGHKFANIVLIVDYL